jgi:hypothetical protein
MAVGMSPSASMKRRKNNFVHFFAYQGNGVADMFCDCETIVRVNKS